MNDTLPSDYPGVTINYSDNPSLGFYYLTNMPVPGVQSNFSNYVMVINNIGEPVKYKKTGSNENGIGYNLKRESNGQITYQMTGDKYSKLMILNDELNPTDSINIGYYKSSKNNDVLILPNGHKILLTEENIPFDFSTLVSNGNPNGTLQFSLIREFDKNNNLVFNWRSIDYVPVDETYEPLTTQNVSYTNTNSIELDYDGNLLLSNAGLNSVIKVSRETGRILWRLGGKNNEFTFIGEHSENAPNYFSNQNHIQRLQNGNITLFDNGSMHNPPYSRAVEYQLDEVSKICELVWEYRHNPDIYSPEYGSVQVLDDESRIISWGNQNINGGIAATELHPDNNVALEFSLPAGQTTKRIYKYPLPACEPLDVTIYELLEGNTYPMHEDNIGIIIKFKKLVGFLYNGLNAERYECGPVNPDFIEKAPLVLPYRIKMKSSLIDSVECEIRFNVNDFPNLKRLNEIVIYHKASNTSKFYQQMATLYDESTNELIINTDKFGDFIFCVPEFPKYPQQPILLSPANEFKVNQNSPVQLSWSTKGYNTGTHLVVGTDEFLTGEKIIDTVVKDIIFDISNLINGQKYYWKVQGLSEAGASVWSDTWSFITAEPFINVTNPALEDELVRDSSYHIIRWTKNIDDSVKLELYRNGELVELIENSVYSVNGAYLWIIPQSISFNSNYQIVITSNANSQIKGESEKFSIVPVLNVNDEIAENNNGVILYQNYPNPASNKSTFKFAIDKFANIKLKIYDSQCREIANILDSDFPNGTYQIEYDLSGMNSGIYIFRLSVNGRDFSGKMSVIK
ncbi:MAG: aryl-sulfate sulfotransferase [Ignavibacteriae bacterium]|nr:aryl-sulfate sulfotransferase [Ignavibacteriota bacterium]